MKAEIVRLDKLYTTYQKKTQQQQTHKALNMKKETGNIQKNRERVYHNNTNGREDERSIMMSK